MSRTLKRAIVGALGFTIGRRTVALLALAGEPQRAATGQTPSTRIARSQILSPSKRICLSSRDLLAQIAKSAWMARRF